MIQCIREGLSGMNFRNIMRGLLAVLLIVFPSTARSITIQEEEELRQKFMMEINAHYEIIHDSVISDYVNNIGEKILAIIPTQPFQYRFYVIKEDVYNAFAGPGGRIFINSGLFEALENEDEIAGIIAHEISHVVCRHISQQMDQSKKVGLGALAGIAAGVLLGATGAGSVGSAAALGSIAAAQSLILSHSREDEMQADQRGVEFLVQAGYNPKGLMTSLTKIRSKQWFGKDQVPTYLMTHPAVEDRMSYLSAWIDANPSRLDRLPRRSNTTFDWVHTRLTGMYGPEKEVLKIFNAWATREPDNPMALYGDGLILTRTSNRHAAVERFRAALTQRAFDPILLMEIGRTYFLDGRYSEAIGILQSVLDLSPDQTEALFYAGRSYMELGKFQDASRMLESLLHTTPDYPDAMFYLGSTYGSLGRTSEACYFLGLYYFTRGNFRNAVLQLEKALETTSDPQKKADIEKILEAAKKQHTVKARESEARNR
jgi:predicted Zn-dependent protease